MRDKAWIAIVCLLVGTGCEATATAPPKVGLSHYDEGPSAPHVLSASAAAVKVITSEDPGFPTEVVAVLDFHTEETSQDKGFDELREKAAELGATEVIGAQFEHGAEGEKSHLSGMAVKPRVDDHRPFVVIGQIDIATPEDADDKGFERMRAQARALGADKVVDVRFEHGEEGGMSHLTGQAVKYTGS
jgi:uncharacterized protein YbjQ (UPF0145 family)